MPPWKRERRDDNEVTWRAGVCEYVFAIRVSAVRTRRNRVRRVIFFNVFFHHECTHKMIFFFFASSPLSPLYCSRITKRRPHKYWSCSAVHWWHCRAPTDGKLEQYKRRIYYRRPQFTTKTLVLCNTTCKLLHAITKRYIYPRVLRMLLRQYPLQLPPTIVVRVRCKIGSCTRCVVVVTLTV